MPPSKNYLWYIYTVYKLYTVDKVKEQVTKWCMRGKADMSDTSHCTLTLPTVICEHVGTETA